MSNQHQLKEYANFPTFELLVVSSNMLSYKTKKPNLTKTTIWYIFHMLLIYQICSAYKQSFISRKETCHLWQNFIKYIKLIHKEGSTTVLIGSFPYLDMWLYLASRLCGVVFRTNTCEEETSVKVLKATGRITQKKCWRECQTGPRGAEQAWHKISQEGDMKPA